MIELTLPQMLAILLIITICFVFTFIGPARRTLERAKSTLKGRKQ